MKTLRILFLFIYSAWGILGLVILLNSMPFNPMSLKNVDNELMIKTFLPEGWGFFTRSPKENDLVILQKKDGLWQKNIYSPIARPSNFFGISRLPRAQSTEMAMLIHQIPENEWRHCNDETQLCLQDTSVAVLSLKNEVPFPVLKDTVCFISKPPVPWAWHDITTADKLPFKFVIVSVK